MKNFIWIASFDIGKKNFAFCVEKINLEVLSAIKNIPKINRYTKDGVCTSEFADVIKQVWTEGEIELIENRDLTVNSKPNSKLDMNMFVMMNRILDEYTSVWNKCSYIIIEQQMSFKGKFNPMALKLGQHCFSYFIFNYAMFKHIIDYPAYYKTKILGAEKKLTKVQRKKWAVTKTIDILKDRDDLETLSKLTSHSKKDDISDTIIQLQSFKYLVFVDKKNLS